MKLNHGWKMWNKHVKDMGVIFYRKSKGNIKIIILVTKLRVQCLKKTLFVIYKVVRNGIKCMSHADFCCKVYSKGHEIR